MYVQLCEADRFGKLREARQLKKFFGRFRTKNFSNCPVSRKFRTVWLRGAARSRAV